MEQIRDPNRIERILNTINRSMERWNDGAMERWSDGVRMQAMRKPITWSGVKSFPRERETMRFLIQRITIQRITLRPLAVGQPQCAGEID
jgi:hypothetical protein